MVEILSTHLAGGTVLGAGLVDIIKEMFEDAKDLIAMAIVVLGIVFVAMTWVRTRSLMPTLGALLLGLFVTWGVANYVWLADRAGQDVDNFNSEAEGEGGHGIDTPSDNRPGN